MGTMDTRLEDLVVNLKPLHQVVAINNGAGQESAHRDEELGDEARGESSLWWPVKGRSRWDSSDVTRVIGALIEGTSSAGSISLAREDREWVLDNARLLRTALREVVRSRRSISEQPHVKNQDGRVLPRPLVIAETFLKVVDFDFEVEDLATYLAGWQEQQRLQMQELWALKPALQLSVLNQLADTVRPLVDPPSVELLPPLDAAATNIPRLITALRKIGEEDWKVLFEQLSLVDEVLRQDPAGAYVRMDYESRELYRGVLAELASHSELDEIEVAQIAVSLALSSARSQTADSRIHERQSHVGYYLLDGGLPQLRKRIGYSAPLRQRLQELLLRFPNSFYLVGIEILTFLIVALVVSGLPRLAPVVASFFLLFIPASQAAVEIMNALVTALLPARRLPKLDFSEGIPGQYQTMAAVPSLLLNERQVQDLVGGLEIRYLANRDPNLYFALVTDGPDSDRPFDEKERLAGYCSNLVRDLNRKYAESGRQPFFLFHRHRVFNPSEQVWMGWERKRGKLLDLNKLLRGAEDRFPIKVGDLSVLPQIRFVITLDCDTQLPRDTAHRLVGALAHPLNRAIVDPVSNTVVSGYGILQPRIGISVNSAGRSRLASIYSGEGGFDIYTRAISDVYQDLYSEGIFTGKGIYEVDVFRQVLEERFPCNTLLSHDLIEGAYTRAALVSDIELIDDYPSHFSAYSRRKHRWVRGDWQITQWLFLRVPGYDGRSVANPTTLVSRWKIFDNLRRSLIDPGLFFLLVAGWLFLPGSPWYWTLATMFLLLAPAYVQAVVSILGITKLEQLRPGIRSAGVALAKAHLTALVTLTFLTHQALVMLDAIVRTVIRHRITRRRLLQWETAAEAESGHARKTLVDTCLAWTPWIALGITLVLALRRPETSLFAAPILLLWAGSPAIARWLSRRRIDAGPRVTSQEQQFLRAAALRTWRYFEENSGAGEHWLIPDNVQESPEGVAHRISPTNLGLLLNARQAAYGFGYLTLPEFVSVTASTLAVLAQFPKHRGHLFNWYDNRTLQPLDPLFISTVDSGNLAASLWTLKQGCLSLLEEPVFPQSLWQGIIDHIRILRELDPEKTANLSTIGREFGADGSKWLTGIDAVQREAQLLLTAPDEMVRWWASALAKRLAAVSRLAGALAPWFGIGYSDALHDLIGDPKKCSDGLTLARVPVLGEQVCARLNSENLGPVKDAFYHASARSEALQCDLRRLASEAGQLADEMDFRFLYNRRKKLLSVGYDVTDRRLHSACYDLLASEARTAAFVAIAKGDIPQESWFYLGRTQTAYRGRHILLSWTGTMFEYLMPCLWMKTYLHTILEQSARAVVDAQQLYCRSRRIPWGISESAHAATDANGCYQYKPFGLPALALKPGKSRPWVIAPYASFLALETHRPAAIRNLRRMWQSGWFGKYGFYEAIDFQLTAETHTEAVPVKCWMAHHQAMSLLAIANLLLRSPFQRYFHAEPQVMATELLLHERCPAGLHVESEPELEPAVTTLGRKHLGDRSPVPHVILE